MATKKKNKLPADSTPTQKKTALDKVLRQRAERRFDNELQVIENLLNSSPITRNLTVEISDKYGKPKRVYFHQILGALANYDIVKEQVTDKYEAEELEKLVEEINDWKQKKI